MNTQDLVDPGAQFGARKGELASLLREPGGVGVVSDFRGPVRAGAGDDKAAGQHRVAGALQD